MLLFSHVYLNVKSGLADLYGINFRITFGLSFLEAFLSLALLFADIRFTCALELCAIQSETNP